MVSRSDAVRRPARLPAAQLHNDLGRAAAAPGLNHGHLNHGRLNQGKPPEGRQALLRARDIRRGDIAVNDMLAGAALAAGRPDKARQYLQDGLDAPPDSAETYIALADLEAKTGHAAAAQTVLLKSVRKAADSPGPTVAPARFRSRRGEAEKAADRPDIGYHYSQALAAGRKEEALSVLHRGFNNEGAAFAERGQARSLLQHLGG